MGRWYQGKVQSYDPSTRRHCIKYRDGDIQELRLCHEAIIWVDAGPLPPAVRAPAAQPPAAAGGSGGNGSGAAAARSRHAAAAGSRGKGGNGGGGAAAPSPATAAAPGNARGGSPAAAKRPRTEESSGDEHLRSNKSSATREAAPPAAKPRPAGSSDPGAGAGAGGSSNIGSAASGQSMDVDREELGSSASDGESGDGGSSECAVVCGPRGCAMGLEAHCSCGAVQGVPRRDTPCMAQRWVHTAPGLCAAQGILLLPAHQARLAVRCGGQPPNPQAPPAPTKHTAPLPFPASWPFGPRPSQVLLLMTWRGLTTTHQTWGRRQRATLRWRAPVQATGGRGGPGGRALVSLLCALARAGLSGGRCRMQADACCGLGAQRGGPCCVALALRRWRAAWRRGARGAQPQRGAEAQRGVEEEQEGRRRAAAEARRSGRRGPAGLDAKAARLWPVGHAVMRCDALRRGLSCCARPVVRSLSL